MSTIFNFPDRKETLREKIEDKISYIWTYRINIPYRNFIKGIKNLIKFFPIVWRDADWDYSYIVDMLKFKIQNTQKYIEKRQRHENCDEHVRYMKLCIKLMDKVYGMDSYDMEYSRYCSSINNFVETEVDGFTEKMYRMETEHIIDSFDYYFSQNKTMYKKTIEYLELNKNNYCVDINDKHLQARTLSQLKQEKAKKLLFKILEAKLDSFWD